MLSRLIVSSRSDGADDDGADEQEYREYDENVERSGDAHDEPSLEHARR